MLQYFPNKVLTRLNAGEVPLGMQMYTPSPELYDIVGYTGFDFVMLDMEHSRVNYETMVHLIRASEASGLSIFIRVPQNEEKYIRYAVESGAKGIIVPHIKSPQDVMKAQNAMRYPPEGRAGICPSVRASGYCQDTWEDYMKFTNETCSLVVLFEDVAAIENAEPVLDCLKPGRDGIGLGLADIIHELYTDPNEKINWMHPYRKTAIDTVVPQAQKRNLFNLGMAWPTPDKQGVENALSGGTNVVMFHPDQYFFYQTCKNIIELVRG